MWDTELNWTSRALILSSCWKQSNSARVIDAQITARCPTGWLHSSYKQIISYKWTVMLFLITTCYSSTRLHPSRGISFISGWQPEQQNKQATSVFLSVFMTMTEEMFLEPGRGLCGLIIWKACSTLTFRWGFPSPHARHFRGFQRMLKSILRK